jgi:hypothetical protein
MCAIFSLSPNYMFREVYMEKSINTNDSQIKKIIHALDQVVIEITNLRAQKRCKRSIRKTDLYLGKLNQTRLELLEFKDTDDPDLLDEYNSVIEEARQYLGLKKGKAVIAVSITLLLLLVAGYIILHIFYHGVETNNEFQTITTTSDNVVTSNITEIPFVWTKSPIRYTEIVFWTLFGLLTWTILSAESWRRSGQDIGKWSLWFFARATLGVFVSMIVILAVDLIDLGPVFKNTFVPVVAAFILGYFASRGYEYFEIIRDKIFPSTKPPVISFYNPVLEYKNEEDKYISTGKNIVVSGYVRIDDDVPPTSMTLSGTLKKDSATPIAIAIDGSGNFIEPIELENGLHNIKVEVTASNKKTGLGIMRVEIKPPAGTSAPPVPADDDFPPS